MDAVSPSSASFGPAASSPAGRRDLTPTEFASTVTAITAAFGDPTRRDIFLFAHASDDGVTAAETAKQTTARTERPLSPPGGGGTTAADPGISDV